MNREQVIDVCDNNWNPTAATMYRISHRTMEQSAHGQWIHDNEGNKFLDFACSYGVFIVGHTQSYIQQAVQKQLDEVAIRPYGSCDENTIKLMAKLADMLPGDLNRSYFCNSGAEAVELAMRASFEANPTRKKMVVISDSYHGKTLGALNILGQTGHRTPFTPLMENVEYVPFGDIAAMKRAIGDGVSAVFIEPVLGGPYLQVPPAGYLKQIECLCRETGSLLIADEIQTAFGRAGKMFAIEYDNIVPDMIILSKGLTGGHAAIAVTVMSEALERKLIDEQGIDPRLLTSGSGGNPYNNTAALAAIEFIEQQDLTGRAQRLGTRLLTGMRQICADYPQLVLEVPGIGLMTGLKCANPAVETAITMVMGKQNIHLGHSMNEKAAHPVLRFYPPLTVTEQEIDQCLAALEQTMKRLGSRPKLMFKLLNQLIKRQYTLPRKFLYKLTGVKQAA